MKIVLNLPTFSCGGAERVAVLLAKAMQTLGHEVWVAAFRPEGEFLNTFKAATTIVDLGHTKPIRGTKALATLINKLEADAVFAFGMHTGIAAALSQIRWGWKCPLIVRNENNPEQEWSQATALNRLFGPLLSRWTARRSRIIVVSEALRQPTAAFLDMPPSHLTTIINPIFQSSPVEGIGGQPLHPWLSDQASPTFIAVGRLEHQKGFDVLVDAFARLRTNVAARLVIFGNGSLHEMLQRRIHTLGLNDSIQLAGHTDHPMMQMRAAHGLVLSSRFEGFGLVLVEALAAGTRVIATNCDYGPAEILEKGRFGTLVPIEDVPALAEAMLRSITEPRALPPPSIEWFEKFSAIEAAKQHLSLI